MRDEIETIDQATWCRREAFELFSGVDYPFYSVTIPLDVTGVKAMSKQSGLSFYYLMIWVCTKAVNSVREFRMRVRGERVVLLERTDPSFTDLQQNAEQFHIVTMPWEEDAASFCRNAKARSAAQTRFVEQEKETDGLIYISCMPWFDFVSLTNERNFDKDDTVPRIAWGKYYEENGRLWVHLSIDVNHRLIDGVHIARLKEAIDAEIAAMERRAPPGRD